MNCRPHMQRRMVAPPIGLLLLLLAPIVASVSAAELDGRVVLEQTAWDLGDGEEATQRLAALSLRLHGRSGWGLQGEVASQQAESQASVLPISRALSGALLLSYHPPSSAWLVQIGFSAPSTAGPLSTPRRLLVRTLGEFALGFADPEIARGWRLHGSLLRGLALQRGLYLSAGAAYEVAGEFEPADGTRLKPGDRLAGLLALQRQGEQVGWTARATLAREGRQELNQMLLREERRSAGVEFTLALRTRAFLLTGAAEYATANRLKLLSGDDYLEYARGGPGRLAQLALGVAPRQASGELGRISRTPTLRIIYRRCMPSGLPLGDGWSLRAEPSLIWPFGSRRLELRAGLMTGRWRPYVEGALQSRETLRGWTVGLSYAWGAEPEE